jgi:hypothetical protein
MIFFADAVGSSLNAVQGRTWAVQGETPVGAIQGGLRAVERGGGDEFGGFVGGLEVAIGWCASV